MSNFENNFAGVMEEIKETLTSLGFEKADLENNENPLCEVYVSEKGAVKFELADGKFLILTGDEAETCDKKLSTSLLDENASSDDIKYVAADTKEALNDKFGKKAATVKKSSQRAQQTVSKTAVKNGSFYDANTLASKLCLVFPELRPIYKEMLGEYKEFFGEEFFTKYGTEKIIGAIKENNPQTMKKLFQILNEIYEDGTNDTQSLIAVTILGELNNDKILLARCVDYMSETMAPPVIEVNRYLASAAGKKAKKQLKNPPAYKPKKQKKPGIFAQAMAQQGGGIPPM